MKLPPKVNSVINKIETQVKPISIFVYGSRTRKDFKKDSDYEIGVLFEKDKKWGRGELAQLHSVKGLNLYPFIYEDFVDFNLDTPFPKAVYMRELIQGAKTVRGKIIVEKMKAPSIRLSDLIEVVIFQLAYALAAVHSSRQGDWITASIEFTKSVFFGARALIILENKKFPLTYDEIANEAFKLDLEDKYKELIKHALEVRKGKKPDVSKLYTNISFLNQLVLQRLKQEFKKGDGIVLK